MRLFILTLPALLAVQVSGVPLRMSNTKTSSAASINTTGTTGSSIEANDTRPSVESRGTQMDVPGTVSCPDTSLGNLSLDNLGVYSNEEVQTTFDYAAILVKASLTEKAGGGEYPHAFENWEDVMTYDCNEGEMWEWPLLSGGNLWATDGNTKDGADRIILDNDGTLCTIVTHRNANVKNMLRNCQWVDAVIPPK